MIPVVYCCMEAGKRSHESSHWYSRPAGQPAENQINVARLKLNYCQQKESYLTSWNCVKNEEKYIERHS